MRIAAHNGRWFDEVALGAVIATAGYNFATRVCLGTVNVTSDVVKGFLVDHS